MSGGLGVVVMCLVVLINVHRIGATSIVHACRGWARARTHHAYLQCLCSWLGHRKVGKVGEVSEKAINAIDVVENSFINEGDIDLEEFSRLSKWLVSPPRLQIQLHELVGKYKREKKSRISIFEH